MLRREPGHRTALALHPAHAAPGNQPHTLRLPRRRSASAQLKRPGAIRGGSRPQTAEIIKTFGERCPAVTVTNNRDKADFVVLLDHEGGKGLLRHRNKVAVLGRDGDAIFSHSTRSLGNSVQDACEAILKAKKAESK